jgi:hypothetical protein
MHSTTSNETSPLGAIFELPAPLLLLDGPVRFLLVSGIRDDDSWGLIGALWLAIEGGNGGFIVAPKALWSGSEMARSYRSAARRGWTNEQIYAYWQGLVGSANNVMIDPQQHADALFQVARRVGAL